MLRVISHQPTRPVLKFAAQINGQVTDRAQWRKPRGDAKRFVQRYALWGLELRFSGLEGSAIDVAVKRMRYRVWRCADSDGVADGERSKKPQIGGIGHTAF